MIVFPRGEVKMWSDLTPGALFGVSIRGETHLAVKIQGSSDEFHCAVLTGLPPYYVRENVVQNSLLYSFPNSKIVPANSALNVQARSRVRSFRIPKHCSSFFKAIKRRSRSQFRMERFKRSATPT